MFAPLRKSKSARPAMDDAGDEELLANSLVKAMRRLGEEPRSEAISVFERARTPPSPPRSPCDRAELVDMAHYADVSIWSDWVAKHKAEVKAIFTSSKGGKSVTPSAFVQSLGYLGFPGDARRIFDEIQRSNVPQEQGAHDGGPGKITLSQYKDFEQRVTQLMNELALEEENPISAFVTMLQKEGGGCLLKAWRRFFDPTGQGRVQHEDFVKACQKVGGGHMAAGIWRQVSPDGRPIEFGALFPRESANLESFMQLMFQLFGLDLEKAWESLDSHRLNWLDFQTFHSSSQRLGFTGNTRQIFEGIVSSHPLRIYIDDFHYLKQFTWHWNRANPTGAGGAMTELLGWANGSMGGPQLLLKQMGLAEGQTVGVHDFAAQLTAMGFMGDSLTVAKLVANQTCGLSGGTEISSAALLATLEGRSAASGKTTHQKNKSCMRWTASPSLGAPSPVHERSVPWDSSVIDISRINAQMFKDQKLCFGSTSKRSPRLQVRQQAPARPRAQSPSPLSEVELRFGASWTKTDHPAFKDELQRCLLRLGLPYQHGSRLTIELASNTLGCRVGPHIPTGHIVAMIRGPPKSIQAVEALPLEEVSVMGYHAIREHPMHSGGHAQSGVRGHGAHAARLDSPPGSPRSHRSESPCARGMSQLRESTGNTQRSGSPGASRRTTFHDGPGAVQRSRSQGPAPSSPGSSETHRHSRRSRRSEAPSLAQLRSSIPPTSFRRAGSSEPRLPTYKIYHFEGTKLRNGMSGYKALIEHVTFYRSGEPKRGGHVTMNPHIVTFDMPEEIDEFRFSLASKDPGYDIVQWQLLGSNDGLTWRAVHLQREDHPVHHGRVVKQSLIDIKPNMLRVVVAEARKLVNKEACAHKGLSDPYCTLWVNTKPQSKVHTKVLQDTLEPKWNARLEVLEFQPGDDLRVMIRDSNRGTTVKSSTKDSLMGQAMLSSKDFHPYGFDGWVNLEGGGRVKLHVRSICKEHMSQEHRLARRSDSDEQWLCDTHVF